MAFFINGQNLFYNFSRSILDNTYDYNPLATLTATIPITALSTSSSGSPITPAACVSIGNGRVVVGQQYANTGGSVTIYSITGTVLNTIISPTSGARFGTSVAVGSGLIVVGAPGYSTSAGAGYVYDLNGNLKFSLTTSGIAAYSALGTSVAIGKNTIVLGAPSGGISSEGITQIYNTAGTYISQLKGSNITGSAYKGLGTVVAVGCGLVVASAPSYGLGQVYLFDLTGCNNTTSGTGTKSLAFKQGTFFTDTAYGWNVAVGNGRIVIGAATPSTYTTIPPYPSAYNTGTIYIYDLNCNLLNTVINPIGGAHDHFSYALAIGSNIIVVGAFGTNNFSGAVHLFDISGVLQQTLYDPSGLPYQYFGINVAINAGYLAVTTLNKCYIYKLNSTIEGYYENFDEFTY